VLGPEDSGIRGDRKGLFPSREGKGPLKKDSSSELQFEKTREKKGGSNFVKKKNSFPPAASERRIGGNSTCVGRSARKAKRKSPPPLKGGGGKSVERPFCLRNRGEGECQRLGVIAVSEEGERVRAREIPAW